MLKETLKSFFPTQYITNTYVMVIVGILFLTLNHLITVWVVVSTMAKGATKVLPNVDAKPPFAQPSG